MTETHNEGPPALLIRPLPVMFGALLGLGLAVLLQQFAVTALTTPFLLAMLIAGAILVGIVTPTLIMAVRVASTPDTRARSRRVAMVSMVTLLTLIALGLVAVSATAQVDGPCSANVNGEPFQGEVTVPENGTVAWELHSRSGNISSWEVLLHYAWFEFPLDVGEDDPPHESTKRDVDNVNEYPRYGVGLYRVTGSSTNEHGETCEAAVDVVVPGNPFTTILGGSAAALTLVGVVGGVASADAAARKATRPGPLPVRESKREVEPEPVLHEPPADKRDGPDEPDEPHDR